MDNLKIDNIIRRYSSNSFPEQNINEEDSVTLGDIVLIQPVETDKVNIMIHSPSHSKDDLVISKIVKDTLAGQELTMCIVAEDIEDVIESYLMVIPSNKEVIKHLNNEIYNLLAEKNLVVHPQHIDKEGIILHHKNENNSYIAKLIEVPSMKCKEVSQHLYTPLMKYNLMMSGNISTSYIGYAAITGENFKYKLPIYFS